MQIFGWTIEKSNESETDDLKSIAKDENDGAVVITNNSNTDDYGAGSGEFAGWATSFDVDPTIVSEAQLINKYREISQVSEVEKAIDIIINEVISTSENDLVDLDLDELEYSDKLKESIQTEWEYILNKMDFNKSGFEILKRWYIDGRFQYQVVVDEKKSREQGIGKLTYIDPRKLKKVRVYDKKKDERTGVDIYTKERIFYMYNETGFSNESNLNINTAVNTEGVQLPEESIVQATSGLLNPSNTTILSYLHKVIRPLNQLKSLEDAAIIYRLSRAPERRIFYIDVGNLPTAKAEQVLKRQMQQYKSKMVYDTASGTVRSDAKNMTMIEDYWLPRRGDGKATEITTLPGGQNLGEMTEVTYFLNKLYNALNVPITRMDPTAGFSTGRTTEITRDEVALMKFINRLRIRFSKLLLDILKLQLSLKNIIHPDEFERIRSFISVEFRSDNHFDEILANEILEGRITILERIQPFRGVYYSQEWISRNILHLSEEDIKQTEMQIKDEIKKKKYPDPALMDANGDFNSSEVGGPSQPAEPAPEPKPAPKPETAKSQHDINININNKEDKKK